MSENVQICIGVFCSLGYLVFVIVFIIGLVISVSSASGYAIGTSSENFVTKIENSQGSSYHPVSTHPISALIFDIPYKLDGSDKRSCFTSTIQENSNFTIRFESAPLDIKLNFTFDLCQPHSGSLWSDDAILFFHHQSIITEDSDVSFTFNTPLNFTVSRLGYHENYLFEWRYRGNFFSCNTDFFA